MGRKKQVTAAQRRFVLAVAEGTARAEAYALAYPKSAAWRLESRSVAAAKLMAKPSVAQLYAEEIDRIEAAARERGEWTRQKSINARLEFKRQLEDEFERRRKAQIAEAAALREEPPVELTACEVVRTICQILQRPILTAGAAAAYHQNLDGLDKVAGIAREEMATAEAVTFTAWEDGRKDNADSDKEAGE